ncbi:hypothetical protein PCANC_17091 [Puccinia coronata f. sp. avenae]|uniref:Uncharacterized protein n=1 Tax=Puccinia coronata f. sp. avenae TaxID=200324 RepID=A0A2N5ST28_9BASI|nr:hypothetical protein PCANC_17091 [Puccinia coronata f. sp. avenae]
MAASNQNSDAAIRANFSGSAGNQVPAQKTQNPRHPHLHPDTLVGTRPQAADSGYPEQV